MALAQRRAEKQRAMREQQELAQLGEHLFVGLYGQAASRPTDMKMEALPYFWCVKTAFSCHGLSDLLTCPEPLSLTLGP